MKKKFITLGLFLLAVSAKADAGFLETLPAGEFSAAGLQKLTPEERARLETLVQRYKTGEVAEVRQQAEAKAAASRQEAEKQIIAAETKAREAEAKAKEADLKAQQAAAAKPAATSGKKQPGWFAALLTLKRAGEKPEKEEPLESRLIGDFSGWNGHTIFRLDDGTQWVQQNKVERYDYAPVLHAPKVKIKPAVISGFWLEIEGVNLNVRVVPMELPEQK
jgi:hypothetical protein